MKILKIFLLFTTLATSSQYTIAQKVRIKDKIAYVDDKPYVKVSDCSVFREECSISNLEGKQIIFMDNLADPKRPGTYFRAVFIGLNSTVEIKQTMRPFVATLYKNNIVGPDGKLIPENVKILLEKYGSHLSLKESEED